MSRAGLNLKYLRKLRGWTQEEFANKLNIKRSLIGAYEEERADQRYRDRDDRDDGRPRTHHALLHRDAHDVGDELVRDHVAADAAGCLAEVLALQLSGERLGEPGYALDEEVTAGEEGDEDTLEHRLLTDDHSLDFEHRGLEGGAGIGNVSSGGSLVLLQSGASFGKGGMTAQTCPKRAQAKVNYWKRFTWAQPVKKGVPLLNTGVALMPYLTVLYRPCGKCPNPMSL